MRRKNQRTRKKQAPLLIRLKKCYKVVEGVLENANF